MNSTTTSSPRLAALFRSLDKGARRVVVDVDGQRVEADADHTVASLLLSLDAPQQYRTATVSGLQRAPVCLMGVCFECLVEVDGQRNCQGCLIAVREGMRIRRQLGDANDRP